MKVLVVDDDVVSRMVLMHLVDSCGGYDIIEAADGQDAWDQLEAGLRPAILFCDLRMPRLSGMELLARVRADPAFEAMPFILVTSSTDTATLEQAASLGVAGFIVKPFQAGQVKVHLAAFSDPPAGWVHRAEPPAATMARLRIDARRLLAYLGGFQVQLTAASGDIDAMAARGEAEAARARIERLHTGCVTLGLLGAADAFEALGQRGYEGDRVHLVLADAVRAAMAQAGLARTLMAAN
ncbi:response regulator [Massilia sp. GCM10020059]|uniref:Response regulator n=1 Tax=Massilia agrisoli TaxID=2892444 RepID=A0ABS8IZL3_9BURK|nr:response regulator [Massilia agrisoli]MCC6072625.1 response regulator [Massilia agrisoli]